MRVPERKRTAYTWRWAAALGSVAVLAAALVMWLAVVPALRVQAASVTTLASATLSADTAAPPAGSGAYTTLTGPVIAEGAAGEIGLGSIVLTLAADFEFRTTGTVTVSVSPTTASGTKIDTDPGCGSFDSSEPAVLAAGTITIYVCDVSETASTITWSGIGVRPLAAGPFDLAATCGAPTFPDEKITKAGTSTITGIAAGDTLGSLAETSGAAATLVWTTLLSDGPVNTIPAPPGVVCVEDQFGSPAVGQAMSWSISSAPVGATCQELIAPDANTNGSGNASTSLRVGHLAGNYEVTASSGAAGPSTDVAAATGGPGASCAPPTPPTATATATSTTPTATPTVTGTPPTSTATPTVTGTPPTATPTTPVGEETVPLIAGCQFEPWTGAAAINPADLAARVSPTANIRGLWAQQPAPLWKGYNPSFPDASDMGPVDRLDVVAFCMSGAATFTRPLI